LFAFGALVVAVVQTLEAQAVVEEGTQNAFSNFLNLATL
jgi:hypothetical protein